MMAAGNAKSESIPYILGIDIGTGSTKGVALSLKGKTLATSQHHYQLSSPEQGYSEQDPEQIWQAFIICVKDVVKELGYTPNAISLSSAMHSLIVADKQGKALHPMITWADTRSESIAQEIRQANQAEALYKQTGTPIHPMTPLCKIIWLQRNNKELVKQAAKFISIKEFVWFKLFSQFQVDYSIASATGLFDIIKLQWSAEACDLAGIDAEQLSEPVDTNYMHDGMNETISKLLGVPAQTPVIIGASDGCCANLGSNVTDKKVAALTIGTSGAVRITSDVPVYNFKAMNFNYLLSGKTYVSGGAVNNGGIAVDWLLRNFLLTKEINTDTYQQLFTAIEQVPAGSDGLLFLPYLHGERAPIWDSQSSGTFVNIKSRHTQNHFLRAALEGVCYALYDVLDTLETSAKVKIEQLNISGGFTNSAVWVQTLADVTGKKLQIVQQDDASAVGAIYLAMQTLYPDSGIQQADKPSIIAFNADNNQHYAKMFPLFRKVYQDLKETMHLLD